jgi:geranylgeranyl diphosphate synthase, type II
MNFKQKYEGLLEEVNKALDNYIVLKDTHEKTIYNAMKYSLNAGGKRLRPISAIATGEMFNGKLNDILPYACAIEMIHTYSLIHDDLPAMDNDDYRRGKLTNHKVFGEATAILAGDALLNYAFEIMMQDMLRTNQSQVTIKNKANAASIIAGASGATGMIGGQIIDLESEGKKISLEVLEYMHKCKTGALIKAPILACAALFNANEEDFKALEFYAEKLGLAFQIKDDILDVEGDLSSMGKMGGSDIANGKSTYVSILGVDKSKRMLKAITKEASDRIGERFGVRSEFLRNLADYLIIREN